MFSIGRNGVITLNRGDSLTIPMYVNIGTVLEPILYPLVSGDKIYFGITEPNQPFEQALVKKIFTNKDFDYENHCVAVKLSSKDTVHLLPGTYYYTAKLVRHHNIQVINGIQTTSEELVDTIIPKTKLIILE